MNQLSDVVEKLLYRRSSRQRVILWLLASGYKVPDLVSMTRSELESVEFPDALENHKLAVLESVSSPADDAVFAYPGGRKLQHSDFYRIITQATKSAFGESLNYSDFKERVSMGD